MHVPEVWFIRYHPAARFHVHPLTEHHQREDVHLPLVLVHHHGHPPLHSRCLQVKEKEERENQNNLLNNG